MKVKKKKIIETEKMKWSSSAVQSFPSHYQQIIVQTQKQQQLNLQHNIYLSAEPSVIVTHASISVRATGHCTGFGGRRAPVSRSVAIALGDLAAHGLEIVQDAVARDVFV